MKRAQYALIIVLTIAGLLAPATSAQKPNTDKEISAPKKYQALSILDSPELQAILTRSITEVTGSSRDPFKPREIAATLLDLRDPKAVRRASFEGETQIYPASVVKLFYLAAIERQIEDGKVVPTPELQRGIHDMITLSSNEATQYILDVLTDTSSGAELPPREFAAWQYKRNRVNRFYASLGYANINVNQKTFCEDAYGVEQQTRNYKGENRNMLTTDATARLMAEIITGQIAGGEATQRMMTLLHRDPFVASTDADDQATGFSGRALIDMKMTDARLWSKAGWTSKARHDAAYIETVDGLKFVLVIFTENHAADTATIPAIARKIIEGLRAGSKLTGSKEKT